MWRFRRLAVQLATAGVWLLCGCGEAPTSAAEPPRCRPGPGATGAPKTIAEAVDLINSLPRPVSVECFVESLERPLLVEATHSIVSAQPADGRRSPRVFVFYEPLILSLAVDGDARHLVEFGQATAGNHTTKGEVAFPVEAPLELRAAYDRVAMAQAPPSTSCGFCHHQEVPSPVDPAAFSSLALRPLTETLEPIEDLYLHHERCEPEVEPERCAYLEALVGPGRLQHHPFPDAYPTLGD